MLEEGQKRAQPLIHEVETKAEEAGFMLRLTPAGVTLIPLTEGRPMTPEEFGALDSARRHEIEARQKPISETVDQVREQLRAIEIEVNDKLRELDRRVAEWVLKGLFDAVTREYAGIPAVETFLEKLREFTLASAEMLRQEPEQPVPARSRRACPPHPRPARPFRRLPLQCFRR